MTEPPLRRYLGIEETFDPRELLGLALGPVPRPVIEAALHRRLALVDSHADAGSPEADAVRRRLRAAAATLIGVAPNVTPASAPPGKLTAFDQKVLAVLVGSRGWNAAARSRLVALSAAHGVSVHGLLKVVTGLGEHAKSGGAGLGMREITEGQEGAVPLGPLEPPPTPAAAIVQALGQQLDAERPWARTRLSLVFGGLTVAVGLVVLALVMPDDTVPSSPDQPAVIEQPVVEPAPVVDQPAVAPGSASHRSAMAGLGRLPGFRGNALPMQAADAADRSAELAGELDWITRRLTVSVETPMPLRRRWVAVITTMADGWLLIDQSTRASARRGILDVMYAAAPGPDVVTELLSALVPPLGVVEPLDVSRGAWLCATLGALAGNGDLPPIVQERAAALLADAIGDSSDIAPAEAWLLSALPQIVDRTEIDRDAFDVWEIWIASAREIDQDHALARARGAAVAALLRTSTDLSRPGPTVSVLGRLLHMDDPTSVGPLRDAIIGAYDDPSVTATDMWVLSSVLAAHDRWARWIDDDLIVPPDADIRMRRRLRDRLDRLWGQRIATQGTVPAARGAGIVVDADGHRRWVELVVQLDAVGAVLSPMERLVTAAHLNAAAALLADQRVNDAEDVFQGIGEALDTSTPDRPVWRRGSMATARRGQPIGADGQWSSAHERARRDPEERLRSIRSLRTFAGSDLGPMDARLLASEAMSSGGSDARSVAQAVIIEMFHSGPNVALAVVDQFSEAPRNAEINAFVSRFTNSVLPEASDASWGVEARLVLVRHALALRTGAAERMQQQTRALVDAYELRLSALRVSPTHRALDAPQETAAMLHQAWRRFAGGVMSSDPVPADLTTLARRHETRLSNAVGPTQRFVAAQIATLELLAFVTVAEQPVLADQVRMKLLDARQRRHDCAEILDQALACERASIELWSLRMAGVEDQP